MRGGLPGRACRARASTGLSACLRISLLTLVCVLAWGTESRAQYLPDSDRPVLSGAVVEGYLQAAIQGGRIRFSNARVVSPRMGQGPELLTMRLDGGSPIIQYECKSSEEQFSFEVSQPGRFNMRRVLKAGEDEVELLQTPDASLELRVVERGQTHRYRAPNLWHLLIADADVAVPVLVPLLERLRPGWNLSGRAQQVEEELLRAISPEYQQDRRRWTELVRQLADDRFSRREAADRELRAAGNGLASYLEQLDLRSLEPEQQVRIRAILEKMGNDSDDDSPEQAAASLMNDPSIWLVFLARPEATTRRTAAEYLRNLLHRPVEFDPDGDASLRERQIRKLAETIRDQ